MVDKRNNTPAHIEFTKTNNSNKGVCKQALDSAPIKAYFDSKVNGNNSSDGKGRVAIGSSISIYD